MADPVIVWSDDPDIPGNLQGHVSGVKYFRIYPGWSGSGCFLGSALPLEFDLSTRFDDVDSAKVAATAHLGKFVGAMHDQMVVMGLLE